MESTINIKKKKTKDTTSILLQRDYVIEHTLSDDKSDNEILITIVNEKIATVAKDV